MRLPDSHLTLLHLQWCGNPVSLFRLVTATVLSPFKSGRRAPVWPVAATPLSPPGRGPPFVSEPLKFLQPEELLNPSSGFRALHGHTTFAEYAPKTDLGPCTFRLSLFSCTVSQDTRSTPFIFILTRMRAGTSADLPRAPDFFWTLSLFLFLSRQRHEGHPLPRPERPGGTFPFFFGTSFPVFFFPPDERMCFAHDSLLFVFSTDRECYLDLRDSILTSVPFCVRASFPFLFP